jgi:hypothetical protein
LAKFWDLRSGVNTAKPLYRHGVGKVYEYTISLNRVPTPSPASYLQTPLRFA